VTEAFATSSPVSSPSPLPYPPSWLDRLCGWIEKLPGPSWFAYLLGFAAFGLVINAVFWIDGSASVGAFDPFNTTFAIFAIYWPALYHYLTYAGHHALRTYRPLLEASDEEFARIDYVLRTLPRSVGLMSIPLGLAIAAIQGPGEELSFGGIVPNTVLPSVGDFVITWFMASAFLCLLIRSIRQLRMVGKLHMRAKNLDLLELSPAHAFSGLTARTGMGVILLLIVAYATDPLSFGSAADIFLTVMTLLAAIGIFVLPIMGIQNRLEEEKERVLHRTNLSLQAVRERMHDHVTQGNYKEMGDTEHALEALIHERELIQSVSTWPWDPRTVRGFASALLLPIFLWLITQLLGKII
jgi:hypothetical protein